MRRTATIVTIWLAAGVGAVALSSLAVSMVGNNVTASRPASLSADQVRDELSSGGGSKTTTATGGAPEPTLASDGSTATTRPATDGARTATTLPPSSPTTQPKPLGVKGDGSTSTTTTTSSPTATVRTYALVGGTATLRFSPSGVTVQDATPKPGYSVDVEAEGGNGVRVEFSSAAHESRVDGWWDGGPQDRIREEDTSQG